MICRSLPALFILVMACGNHALTQSSISISFQEVRSFAQQHSAQTKLIEQYYDMQLVDKRINLQWRNPELEFEQEYVKNAALSESERTILLSKSFTMPWVYGLNRSRWKHKVQTAAYDKQSAEAEFTKTLKNDYIKIKLLEERAKLMKQLRQILQRAASAAKTRHEEGAISGLDQKLIQMSLINIQGEYLRLSQQRRELLSRWKTMLGIDRDVDLTTPVYFRKIPLEPATSYFEKWKSSAGYLKYTTMLQAMDKFVHLQKASIFPEINIFGGYKQVDKDLRGYAVGASIPLPVLNQNRAQIQKAELERNVQRINLDMHYLKINNEIDALVKSISQYANAIQGYEDTVENTSAIIENLVYSYGEGWISLSDLINGIGVSAETVGEYYDQVAAYYAYFFRLEALIQEDIVKF